MLLKLASAALFGAAAMAHPLQHQHHQHEKKDIVTRSEVVYVTVNADGSVDSPAAAAPTTSPTTEAVATSVSAPVASSPAGSSSSAAGTSTPSSAPSGSFSAPAKGVTYSPYNADGTCKSASQVKSDLSKLTSYSIIRLYGVDCNQVENVLAALAPGQKIFAGIFFMNDIAGGISQLASAVKAHGGWDVVHTVSIGNELVNGGQANPGQIAGYVQQGRSALKAAGYTGPVVSVDTFIAVINNPSLCEYSDYMAVNAHAFFDGHVVAGDSGDWLLQQIQRVSSACGGKNVFITETGWPTQGDNNNVAVPLKQNQEAALSSISGKCGNDAIFFNAYNDFWKAPGAFNAEQYWGIN